MNFRQIKALQRPGMALWYGLWHYRPISSAILKVFPEISHVRSEKIGISKYVSEQKLFTEINREREFSKSEGTHGKS